MLVYTCWTRRGLFYHQLLYKLIGGWEALVKRLDDRNGAKKAPLKSAVNLLLKSNLFINPLLDIEIIILTLQIQSVLGGIRYFLPSTRCQWCVTFWLSPLPTNSKFQNLVFSSLLASAINITISSLYSGSHSHFIYYSSEDFLPLSLLAAQHWH